MAPSRCIDRGAIVGVPLLSGSRRGAGRPPAFLLFALYFIAGQLLALIVLTAYASGLLGAAAHGIWEAGRGAFAWVNRTGLGPWLEAALLIGLLALFLVKVRIAAADPERRQFRPRSLVQFRLSSLLLLTTVVALTLGVSRGTGLNPCLVFVGWLYAGGPWSALLAGTLTRFWRPRQEFSAACLALVVLVVLALAYSMISGFTGRGYDLTLLDLLHVTTILWCPQVLLYLSLRPLLAPQED